MFGGIRDGVDCLQFFFSFFFFFQKVNVIVPSDVVLVAVDWKKRCVVSEGKKVYISFEQRTLLEVKAMCGKSDTRSYAVDDPISSKYSSVTMRDTNRTREYTNQSSPLLPLFIFFPQRHYLIWINSAFSPVRYKLHGLKFCICSTIS